MVKCENSCYDQHKQRVQHIGVDFLLHEASIISLSVLGHAKDGPDHDQHAAEVENTQESLPGPGGGFGLERWVHDNSDVENSCHQHEAAKEGNLNAQADENNGVSEVLSRLGLGTGE